jgi:hypothetical protein
MSMVKIKQLVSTMAFIGFFLITVPLMYVIGPIVEGKYFPITTGVIVDLVTIEGDKMLFHAYGKKVRDCKLVDVKALVDQDGLPESPHTKAVIYVVNDGVGDRNRPLGYQDLGIWAIHPIGKEIFVQTWYQCHPFWNTYTYLGQWPYSVKPHKLYGAAP